MCPLMQFALLLVVYTTEIQGNIIQAAVELDNNVRRELNITPTEKDITKHDENSTQHKKDNQELTKPLSNYTDDDYMYENYPKNDFYKDSFSKNCNSTRICIPICCKLGYRLSIEDECIRGASDYPFPEVNGTNEKVNDIFELVVSDSCRTTGHFVLKPDIYRQHVYMILSSGEAYHPYLNFTFPPTSYCFAVGDENKYELALCLDKVKAVNMNDEFRRNHPRRYIKLFSLIVSLPFLLSTFSVYTMLKELRNLHGYLFRGYIGSLFVKYIVLIIQLSLQENALSNDACISLAYITQFSFLASFFWLNVMCFNIWWVFEEFRPLQEGMTREDKKKFIIYSIYVWGCTFIFTIICAIMDSIPNMSENFITPKLGTINCWFNTQDAEGVYFYGPTCIAIILNVCMFISTVWKFVRHNRNVAPYLTGSESRRHNNNKQSFMLYLKLFILMDIYWALDMISWVVWMFRNSLSYYWIIMYFSDLTSNLQGPTIFVVFVWKNKIKKLLLKKFDRKEHIFFSFFKNSSSSNCNGTLESGTISLQNKTSPCVRTNRRRKNLSDESEHL